MKASCVPLALLALSATTEAFAPAAAQSGTPTALNLLPNQGCQLAAAAAAAQCTKKENKSFEEEGKQTKSKSKTATPTNAARELAKRIFNLPAQVLKVAEDSSSKGFPFEIIADHELDEVVYPVVGFQFVKLESGSMRAVPSPNAVGACNINSIHQSNTQPVYGWFSPACRLGNSFAVDDESYCMDPELKDGDDM